MNAGQHTPKDDAVRRVLIIFLVFGLVCSLPAIVRTYLPDYTAIVWRLVVTLVFAVVIVMVHRKVDASRRRREDPVPGAAPWRRVALRRILLLWLILFLLNTLFLAG
ncbi:MAG: hypothetical protein QNJ04_07235 [Desulfobacterales bacterium]|nr:hypothetical protein [Desulfobacterales bacterium]